MTSQPPRRLGLQPFDRDQVRDYLERNSMPFTVDSDGDFSVNMRLANDEQPESGLDIAIFLMASGTNGEVYAIRGTAAAPVPEEFLGPMIGTCNRWNTQSLFNKAYVVTQDATDDNPALGRVVVEQSIPLEAGVTQMQIDEFTQQAVNGIVSFWTWLASEGIIQFTTQVVEEQADPNLN